MVVVTCMTLTLPLPHHPRHSLALVGPTLNIIPILHVLPLPLDLRHQVLLHTMFHVAVTMGLQIIIPVTNHLGCLSMYRIIRDHTLAVIRQIWSSAIQASVLKGTSRQSLRQCQPGEVAKGHLWICIPHAEGQPNQGLLLHLFGLGSPMHVGILQDSTLHLRHVSGMIIHLLRLSLLSRVRNSLSRRGQRQHRLRTLLQLWHPLQQLQQPLRCSARLLQHQLQLYRW